MTEKTRGGALRSQDSEAGVVTGKAEVAPGTALRSAATSRPRGRGGWSLALEHVTYSRSLP